MAVRCKILRYHLGIQRWHSFIFCFDKKKKHSSDLTSLRLKNILFTKRVLFSILHLKNLNFVFTGGEMYLQCVHSFFTRLRHCMPQSTTFIRIYPVQCQIWQFAGLVFSPETRVNSWKILKILKTEFSPLKKKVA